MYYLVGFSCSKSLDNQNIYVSCGWPRGNVKIVKEFWIKLNFWQQEIDLHIPLLWEIPEYHTGQLMAGFADHPYLQLQF